MCLAALAHPLFVVQGHCQHSNHRPARIPALSVDGDKHEGVDGRCRNRLVIAIVPPRAFTEICADSEGDCGFLAANLCAHSIFGEDALANVSIEKASPLDEGSPIVGHIRIRAKSQGMALTLGDKVRFVLQTESKYVNRSDPNMLTDQRRATGPTGGGGVLVLLSNLC